MVNTKKVAILFSPQTKTAPPASQFEKILKSLELKWCVIMWGEDYTATGILKFMGDCVKLSYSGNHVSVVKISAIHAISPLSPEQVKEAELELLNLLMSG